MCLGFLYLSRMIKAEGIKVGMESLTKGQRKLNRGKRLLLFKAFSSQGAEKREGGPIQTKSKTSNKQLAVC